MATVNGIDSDVCEGGVNDGESDGMILMVKAMMVEVIAIWE